MKKFNIVVGIILLIASILTALACYFNVLPKMAMIVTGVIAAVVMFIATLQQFNYREWHEYNPGKFWSVWSCIVCAITVVVLYLCGFEVLDQHLAGAIIIGGTFSGVPIIGVFFGELGECIHGIRHSALLWQLENFLYLKSNIEDTVYPCLFLLIKFLKTILNYVHTKQYNSK